MVVLFPAPFGPRKPNTSPLFTVKFTSFTASNDPKDFARFLTSIIGSLMISDSGICKSGFG
jgi:hypothetical protein